MLSAEEVIKLLNLKPHPKEGGFFAETYRSGISFPAASLPAAYRGDRSASTAIYYLLTPTTFSEMHRVATDEVFHFYAGGPVEMLQLWPDGSSRVVILETDLAAGHRPQLAVPAGIWQGSRLLPGGDWALLGATVAPGFDYADYESGKRGELIKAYPAEAERIRRLTSG